MNSPNNDLPRLGGKRRGEEEAERDNHDTQAASVHVLPALTLLHPHGVTGSLRVRYAPARPEVGHGGSRLTANQAGLDSRSATSLRWVPAGLTAQCGSPEARSAAHGRR